MDATAGTSELPPMHLSMHHVRWFVIPMTPHFLEKADVTKCCRIVQVMMAIATNYALQCDTEKTIHRKMRKFSIHVIAFIFLCYTYVSTTDLFRTFFTFCYGIICVILAKLPKMYWKMANQLFFSQIIHGRPNFNIPINIC